MTSTATSSIGGGAKADQKGVEGLSADMKAVTMAAADSKELTPRGTSSKVRNTIVYCTMLDTLFCTVLYCALLHCTERKYTGLCYIALHCTVPYYIAFYCTSPHFTALN